MRRRMFIKVFMSCFIIYTIGSGAVRASGVFELELMKLDFKGSLATEVATPSISARAATSSPRVFICLKTFTTQPIDGPCTFGNASIFVQPFNQQRQQADEKQQQAGNQQHEQQESDQQQHGSLVRIPLTFKWTKSFTIILTIEEPVSQTAPQPQLEQQLEPADNQLPHRRLPQQRPTINGSSNAAAPAQLQNETTASGLIVDRHMLTENEVIPDLEINSNKPWTVRSSRGLKSSLSYRFRLYCAFNYYGDGCNTYCRPRDDQFGHYKCSPSGQKVCLEGWQGQENNCLQARCLSGCQTGQCDLPATCKCRAGWTGARCDQCLTYPGCQNGYCLSPGQCLCHQNWGGVLCDQDLNYCSTHEPCKNNATCQNVAPGRYKCNCPDGYADVNCHLSASRLGQLPANSLQQHHQLAAGCALNPCLNGGVCLGFGADKSTPTSSNKTRRQHRCQCANGWTGDYCQWPEAAATISVPIETGDSGDYYEGANQTRGAKGELLGELNEEAATGGASLGADSGFDVAPDNMDEARIASSPIIESPSFGIVTVPTAQPASSPTVSVMDMRHIISGVVVASAVGVFMAALLLAWCCLAAFERNGFSFIQMNIVRGAAQSDGDGPDQAVAVRATLRRVQQKIRNSFRCPPKRHIKPETKLSIENVLKPPPSYEESKHRDLHHAGVVIVEGIFGDTSKADLCSSAAIGTTMTNMNRVEVSPDEKSAKSDSLVIRGAIEQKLLQVSSNKSKQIANAGASPTSQTTKQRREPTGELRATTTATTTRRHISSTQLNCPKHGHLDRSEQYQPVRSSLNQLDLKIRYPNEIVIRAEDLYEDHSALK